MRAASVVLQIILSDALSSLHAFRRRGLLLAVEAAVRCRALTLIDLACSYPVIERVRSALKRLDRLLSNRGLHADRPLIYQAMTRWLLTSPTPLIIVDWSDLKRDGQWCLLRAAVPVKGRCLSIAELVVPRAQQGNGKVQRKLLLQLKALLPEGVCPIVITDAGFRTDWFADVESFGWHWIGRLRGRMRVRLNGQSEWLLSHELHSLQRGSARDLQTAQLTCKRAHKCRLVIGARKALQVRHSLTQQGTRSQDRRHIKSAQRTRECRLLACSLSLRAYRAAMIETMYRRRMQIEESFRDLKSHRYGMGFEDSQTRKLERLQMLLLIHALTQWAMWVIGSAAIKHKLDDFLKPNASPKRQYSTLRIGKELMLRGCRGLLLHQLVMHDIHPDAIPPPNTRRK